MIVKRILDEDFVNYKVPSMYIAFPKCTFKCGHNLCQNSDLAISKDIDIAIGDIVDRYMDNPITKAFVFAGLEPFDSERDLFTLIRSIRSETNDDIVIFTGYYKNEILTQVEKLKKYKNIVIKFGRYIPEQQPHFDTVLGVKLASDNQYAEKIS